MKAESLKNGKNGIGNVKSNSIVLFGDEQLERYRYDAGGRTIEDGRWRYRYGAQGRLAEITRASTGQRQAAYRYNALGERARKLGTSVTYYHYDLEGRLLAETDASGQTRAEYLYLGDEPLALSRSGQIYYYHNDHLGTPQKLTDGAGQVVWSASYRAFGEASIGVGYVTQNLRFPGQYYDEESGLHYNYHRYYDPDMGRYLTSDPIGLAGGMNTYIYVGNNPLTRIDPTGLDWKYDSVSGTLTQTDSNGKPINSWPAGSGPWGSGQLPPGKYTLPSSPVPVPPDHPRRSSYCDYAGNCWWQPITPNFPTNRTGFGIHPDGNVPGTAGCIGATDKDTTSLWDALRNDQGPLTVK